jgi:hypothetical protein
VDVNIEEPRIIVTNESNGKEILDQSCALFEDIELDDKRFLHFKIQNKSNIRVFVDANLTNNALKVFNLSKAYFSIIPYKSEYLTIDFQPKRSIQINQLLTLKHSKDKTHRINLTGTGVIKNITLITAINYHFETMERLKDY